MIELICFGIFIGNVYMRLKRARKYMTHSDLAAPERTHHNVHFQTHNL